MAVQAWKVEHLRVTGFTPSAEPEPIDALWAALVGALPDKIDQRPKEGITSALGSFEGAALALSHTRMRTDWVWSVAIDPVAPPSEVPSIGEFEKSVKTFVRLAKEWLNRKPSTTRLAFGGVLVLPVANKEDGYKTVQGFLPQVKIDPVGSADFLYRINRPRPSKVVDGLPINRLSTWSVMMWQALSMQLTVSAGVTDTIVTSSGPSISACRLEFDVSSDAARKEPIESGQTISLLDELTVLATEIAARGDVP